MVVHLYSTRGTLFDTMEDYKDLHNVSVSTSHQGDTQMFGTVEGYIGLNMLNNVN